MMDKLTALVFQRCQGSLYEEHRLLFATLLCLNMQEETQQFTEEELSLLLQGLGDFFCLQNLNLCLNYSFIKPSNKKVGLHKK